jgi:hypothetical protein
MPKVGWRLRSKRLADCVRSMVPLLLRFAGRRGPFDSRGSRSRRDRPRSAPCEAGAGDLLGEEQEGWWWERSQTPFRHWIRASAEVRGGVDARLAVRQQDRRRDTTRE